MLAFMIEESGYIDGRDTNMQWLLVHQVIKKRTIYTISRMVLTNNVDLRELLAMRL